MRPVVVRYREYAPCAALRDSVRAFFSFAEPVTNDPASRATLCEISFSPGHIFCSPMFADGHASLVFNLPRACRADGVWRACPGVPRGDLIGPSTMVGASSLAERAEAVGVYFRAGAAAEFIGVPGAGLRDRVIGLENLWGPEAFHLAEELNELSGEAARINRLELALLKQAAARKSPGTNIDISGMTAWIIRQRGQASVERLAEATGVSRQHLTRVFRRDIGVTPKMYCRLARFQSTLAYTDPRNDVDWARVAARTGYADQSHMIAEFRRFSSLTPEGLRRQGWFHPFIELARRRWQVDSG
jgi:AraC-like DNA-binding protein